jgi:hypothetical protein
MTLSAEQVGAGLLGGERHAATVRRRSAAAGPGRSS